MTTLLLIILLAATVVVFLQRKKNPEATTPLLYGLVALIFVVSGARLFCSGGSRRGAMSEAVAASEAFNKASAYRLGQAVAEDVASGSSLLVIHAGGGHEWAQRQRDSLMEGFREGLGTGYTLHLEDALPEAASGVSGDGEMFEEPIIYEAHLTEEVLMRNLSRYSDVEAVVSFVGAPFFGRPPPPGSIPPLYVMGGIDDSAQNLLQRGIVQANVAYRTTGVDWNARPQRGMSQEDIFNLRFELQRAGR